LKNRHKITDVCSVIQTICRNGLKPTNFFGISPFREVKEVTKKERNWNDKGRTEEEGRQGPPIDISG